MGYINGANEALLPIFAILLSSYFGGGVAFWRTEAYDGVLIQDITLNVVFYGGLICYLAVLVKCSMIRGLWQSLWDSRGLYFVLSSVLFVLFLAPELVLLTLRPLVYTLTSNISIINVPFHRLQNGWVLRRLNSVSSY